MLAVLVSTCKHLSQQGGFQSDRIVKWACWRWPIALVRGVCAVGTPFDILGGRGADGGGSRLDGSARGSGAWRCTRLGGLGGSARGLGCGIGGSVRGLGAWGLGGGARGSGAWRWCLWLGGRASGCLPVMAPPRPVRGWFPKNVARNFRVNLSNFELASLELQRFQALLKVQAIELRATFRGSGLALVILRFPNDVMVPNNVMVSQKCRT